MSVNPIEEAPSPTLRLVNLLPICATPDDGTAALIEVEVNGVRLRRCRLIRLPDGRGFTLSPPMATYFDPTTSQYHFLTLASWPRALHATLLAAAVERYQEARGTER